METTFGLLIIGALVALLGFILTRNDTQINQLSCQQRSYNRNWTHSYQVLMDKITPKVPVRTFTHIPLGNANRNMIETPINRTKAAVINCDEPTPQLVMERENLGINLNLNFTPGLSFKPKK